VTFIQIYRLVKEKNPEWCPSWGKGSGHLFYLASWLASYQKVARKQAQCIAQKVVRG